MNKDTVLGAGGLQSDWAVWTGGMDVSAKSVAPEVEQKSRQALRMENEVEVSTLKAQNDLLGRENELLRQRLAIADRQVEVKDSQINDFKAITENLTRQNQVLLMLAQGVPMESILKGGRRDIEVYAQRVTGEGGSARRVRGTEGTDDDALRDRIALRLRELAQSGMNHGKMAEALNYEGVPTLSGIGKWDRRKIGKFVERECCHGGL